jgi:hypothetical protein
MFAVLGASALLVGGVSSVGTAAQASTTVVPRTYTVVMSPTSAVPGQPTGYSVVVKNTSTRISALDHFVLLVPAGFTVVPGSVTAPRGGWVELLDSTGTQLSAATGQPLRYGLRKGESMTVRFSATDSTACDPRAVTWKQKADGIVIDPWVPQSPDPAVQMTPVADHFEVTSVTDETTPLPGNQVIKDHLIDLTGQFLCGSESAPAGSDSTLTLSGGSPGSLGGNLGATVNAADRTATIAGATYSVVQNPVNLTVAWSAGAGGSVVVNVVGAGTVVQAQPHESTSLALDGATATLKSGASGAVVLTVQACTDQPTVACSGGTEISLSGTFKDGSTPLYTDSAPATLTRICPVSECAHPDGEPANAAYSYNLACSHDACHGGNSDFGEREVEEDFAAFPIFVSLRQAGGSYSTFQQAPRCVPLPTSDSDPGALLTQVGQIVDPAARSLGFCVDVNAITRAGNSFTGALSMPVLFVEDPRLRP